MAFGTADRRKADVAEGVALAVGYTRHPARQPARRRRLRRRRPALAPAAPGTARPAARRSARCARSRRAGEAWPRRSPSLDGLARQRVARRGRLRLPRPARLAAARCCASPGATRRSRSRSATRASRSSPTSGELRLVDPETGRQLRVDTGDREPARALRRGGRGEERRRARAHARRRRRPARRALDPGRLAANAGCLPAHERSGSAAVSFGSPELLLGLLFAARGGRSPSSWLDEQRRERAAPAWALARAPAEHGRVGPGGAVCVPAAPLPGRRRAAPGRLRAPERALQRGRSRARRSWWCSTSRGRWPPPTSSPTRLGAADAILTRFVDTAAVRLPGGAAHLRRRLRGHACRRPTTAAASWRRCRIAPSCRARRSATRSRRREDGAEGGRPAARGRAARRRPSCCSPTAARTPAARRPARRLRWRARPAMPVSTLVLGTSAGVVIQQHAGQRLHPDGQRDAAGAGPGVEPAGDRRRQRRHLLPCGEPSRRSSASASGLGQRLLHDSVLREITVCVRGGCARAGARRCGALGPLVPEARVRALRGALLLAAAALAASAAAVPRAAAAGTSARGFRRCIAVAGPWVAVPANGEAEFLLDCPQPRRHRRRHRRPRRARRRFASASTAIPGARSPPVARRTSRCSSGRSLRTIGPGFFQPFIGCIPTSSSVRADDGRRPDRSARRSTCARATCRCRPGRKRASRSAAPRASGSSTAGLRPPSRSRAAPPVGLVSAGRRSRPGSAGRCAVAAIRASAALPASAHPLVQLGVRCTPA